MLRLSFVFLLFPFFTGLLFEMFYGTVLFWVTQTFKLLFIDWNNFFERLLRFVFVLFFSDMGSSASFPEALIKILPLDAFVYLLQVLQHLVQEKLWKENNVVAY